MHCQNCSANLTEQDLNAGNLKGLWAEAYVLEAIRQYDQKPDYYTAARKSSYFEDSLGYDIMVEVHLGFTVEIPIQVKSSKGSLRKVHPTTAFVKVITQKRKVKTQDEIAKEVFRQIESLKRIYIWKQGCSKRTLAITDGLLVEDTLCMY